MRFHFVDGGCVSSANRFQQLLGLALQLVEICVFAEGASGKRLVHNELLSRLRVHVSRCARCPLARAEKSPSKQDMPRSFSGGHSPSRGHGGALTRQRHLTKATGCTSLSVEHSGTTGRITPDPPKCLWP